MPATDACRGDQAELPGQPIPPEILQWATPDMLQLMAMACHLAGNQMAVEQIAQQQMRRVGQLSWVYGQPGAREERERKGRSRKRPPIDEDSA